MLIKFKTLLFTMLCFFAMSGVSFAGDCFQDPIYDRDWSATVTTGVRVRDVACMEGSAVMTTLPVGEIVHIVAETDGWYKVQGDFGSGWIGQWLVSSPVARDSSVDASNNSSNENDSSSNEEYIKPPASDGSGEFISTLYDILGHNYENAIRFIYDVGVVSGYPDGSFQPDKTITRAELLKIILEAKYSDSDELDLENYADKSCFNDSVISAWYNSYLCFAKENGIISGYQDGSFAPNNEISFSEAMSIVLSANDYEYDTTSPWYKGIIEKASENNFIPLDVKSFDENISRAQMAEIITRLLRFENNDLELYLGDDFNERVFYKDLI